jgi:hypothetical protein
MVILRTQFFIIPIDIKRLIRVYFQSLHFYFARVKEGKIMEDRRQGARFIISFPVRVRWKDENGHEVIEEGLTENVGQHGTLVYLPRNLPSVGGKVEVTVTEDPNDPVTATAQVIRLERNAAHPQAALQLTDSLRAWKKKVWEHAAAIIAAERPDDGDDW